MADFNPFDPELFAEADELHTLQTALRLAQGFALFLVRCNDPAQRRDIIAALRADRPDAGFEEIELHVPIRHLLDELQNRLIQPAPAAVLVSGLEYSLPDSQNAPSALVIANLNAARNSFPRVLKCPLVIFVPEYALVAMMQGAPDFFSVRSGMYFFARTPEQSGELARAMLEGNMWQAENMSAQEKAERISEITNLLSDYQALPHDKRDKTVELRLMTRLSGLFLSTGSWDKSLTTSRVCIELAQELKDLGNEGRSLQNLANVASLLGYWQEAETSLHRSLEIFQQLGLVVGVATSLNSLGLLFQERGDLETAEKFYNASLRAIKSSEDKSMESRTLNNLGMVWQLRGNSKKAQEAYQRSSELKKEMGDHRGQAYTMANLGNLYLAKSQWQEALNSYQNAMNIFREVGDMVALGRTLNNVALLHFRQGDAESARIAAQEGRLVLENTQDSTELQKSLWISEDIAAYQTEELTKWSKTAT